MVVSTSKSGVAPYPTILPAASSTINRNSYVTPFEAGHADPDCVNSKSKLVSTVPISPAPEPTVLELDGIFVKAVPEDATRHSK